MTVARVVLALITAAATLARPSLSFTFHHNPAELHRHVLSTTSQFMFFANEVQEDALFQVTPLDGNDESIRTAAGFMVDAFWLKSPQAMSEGSGDAISPDAKSSLLKTQTDDLMRKYGERLGKRKLDAVMIAAKDDATAEMLGLVTIEVRLLDSISKALLNAERSELLLTNAISSLGPKQRREYKDASVIDAANALLPPEISAVCSFSNLCVSPNARRRGVAASLCKEAETFAKKLGFDEMHLCVESANTAAKSLYAEKLGYGIKFMTASKSLRVDTDAGVFQEFDTDILIMNKKI